MPHKDPEQRRAYGRARYHKRKLAIAQRIQKMREADPSSCAGLMRKCPGKAQRKISKPDKYVEDILTWMEKKGVE